MFSKILLAVDLNQSKGKRRAAEAAVQLVRTNGAELHILNVLPDNGMAMVSAALGADHSAKIHAETEAALAAWAAETLPSDITATPHVATGTIYDQIIQAAETFGCDAIVIGAHRPELKDYLVGPNAARVVRHAAQSVFVIR
jgi:nucleotide-binding universal stress UspA family protein